MKTRLAKISVSPKGAWSSSTNYEQLDIVTYNNCTWLAK